MPDPQQDLQVQIVMLDDALEPPAYAQPGDAGADLRSRIDVSLAPGERRLVPTGVSIALPAGYAGFVHPRSGLAARHGLSVVNAPGTIDAGYRGEVQVILLNTDRSATVHLARGDRVAQLVIQRVEQATFVQVQELPESVRGANGFGSTGGFTPVPEAHNPATGG
ncbi:dUTP diphosphatase [Arthrobacter sp. MSA 4-2]|uniref:dUTP diphosphatase n=1 Tax=Arthrobacter sp. MSA 4-2 TaxID=2794349 RepID=UPI0027DD0CDB|nr:dUTP diphosphatase [Arthrobacter sp. MSA 4-2]